MKNRIVNLIFRMRGYKAEPITKMDGRPTPWVMYRKEGERVIYMREA